MKMYLKSLLRHPILIMGAMVLLLVAGQQSNTQQVATASDSKPQVMEVKGAHTTAAQPVSTSTTKPAAAPKPAPASAAVPAATPKSAAAPASKPAVPSAAATKTAVPAATAPAATANDIATEASCPGQGSTATTTTVLVCMTSYARTQHGFSTVSGNAALMAAAAAKAQDIANCGFSHTACGHDFNYWFGAKGYTGNCEAENIAMGQPTPGSVFVAWMNSAGHRANILGTDYRDIGVAVLASSSGPIWVMELGGCH